MATMLQIFELVAEELLKQAPQTDLREALDRVAAKVTRQAGEAALAARFPDSQPPPTE